MSFDWWTFGIETVNFAILMAILHRLLYKPVLAVISRRQEAIDDDLSAAAETRASADETLAQYQAKLAGFDKERQARLGEERAAMQEERRRLLHQTRAENDDLRRAVRDQLSRERREAAVEVRQHATALAVKMAETLLAEVSRESATELYFERACQHLALMPKDDLAHILVPHDGEAKITVVTPRPLGARRRDAWRDQLEQVLTRVMTPEPDDKPASYEFVTDESLIAGVELRCAGAVVRFAWGEALRTVARELERDADAA